MKWLASSRSGPKKDHWLISARFRGAQSLLVYVYVGSVCVVQSHSRSTVAQIADKVLSIT